MNKTTATSRMFRARPRREYSTSKLERQRVGAGSPRPFVLTKLCRNAILAAHLPSPGGTLKKLVWLVPILLAWLSLARTTQIARAQAPACTTANPAANDPSATVCVSEVIVKVDGTSPYNSFVVSWVSKNVESGSVQLVNGGTFNDTRGASFTGITHYVQVSDLQSSTSYQFDVNSGGSTFNNNNQHWGVNLGPPLPDAPPNKITGMVENQNGSDATDAIVYTTIQHAGDQSTSSLLSQPLTGDNVFLIPLGDARTGDYAQRFTFNRNKDKLIITANGPGGFTSTTVTANLALPPQPNPPNVILTLGSGVVAIVTATPSPLPPTSTPTPITPSATPTLPPASATAQVATETAVAFTVTPTRTPMPPTDTPPPPTAPPTAALLPTLTLPPITIAPADATAVAEATVESIGEGPFEITRVAPHFTPAPAAGSLFGGSALGGLLLPFLAFVAFTAAAALVVLALIVWKR
jgi:hypothetical protein